MKAAWLGLGLLLFAADRPVAATSSRLTEQQFRILLHTIAEGWNEGDARKAADCFAENAIYQEPPDKQIYRGREALFKFFGGNEGRRGAMEMTWRNIVFNERTQTGAGEFTFRYGTQVHGLVIIKVVDKKIAHWREYFYESELSWEKFIGENKF